MHIILWEYYVTSDKQEEFEDNYSSNGTWAGLFKEGDGYLGTELIRATEIPERYITVDRWESAEAYEAFLSQWKDEYQNLDSQCEGLSEDERYLGTFEGLA